MKLKLGKPCGRSKNKIEEKLEKIAKEYQCLISRDEHGNIIRLTEAEVSGNMYARLDEGWWVKEYPNEPVVIPYEKGDEERNKKIIKEYWEKLYTEETK